MTGNPEAPHSPEFRGSGVPPEEGVYAFKSLDEARDYMLMVQLYGTSSIWYAVDYDTVFDDAFVWGEVELWGTVWEHEHGYRAQFARVHSLKDGTKGADLKALSELYKRK